MKLITSILILASVFSLSFGQRKIKKVEVTERGFEVKLNYNPILDEISFGELTFKITPISPEELNSLFVKENSYNGKFNYSYYEESRETYFLKRRRRKEKTDLEFLVEGANWLIENDKVNQQEYEDLVKLVEYYYNIEEAEEIYGQNRFTYANPYYIEDHYLSVFKVETSNSSNVYQRFDDEIIFQTGTQLLAPLNKEQITHLLEIGNLHTWEKQQSLERNHFNSSFSIPPNAKITKYLAFLPFNYDNQYIEISIKGNDVKAKWEIIKDEKQVNELYTYYEFDIEYSHAGYTNASSINFNILSSQNLTKFLDKELLFIDQENLGDEFEIVTLSLYSDKLYYNRNSGRGLDLVNLERFRRSPLKIDLIKINDLKKKEKIPH